MKSHGLIMQPHSVRSMLAGIKTETRRIPSPRNCTFDGGAWPKELNHPSAAWKTQMDWKNAKIDPGGEGNPFSLYPYLHVPWLNYNDTTHRIYPRIQPGDEIWIKEAFAFIHISKDFDTGIADDFWGSKDIPHTATDYWIAQYKADPHHEDDVDDRGFPWRSPMYMPRHAARIVRRVESVGFEFLQDITPAGAMAEGINPNSDKPWPDHLWSDRAILLQFEDLWDSINAKRGYPWSANPPVMVIKFGKENLV